MRTLLKGAWMCLLAAGFSGGVMAAEKVAEWKGFADDALTSGTMTADLNGNTWDSDNGYAEISTNALLLTGTSTWNCRTGNLDLTVVARVSNLTNETDSAVQTLVALKCKASENLIGLMTVPAKQMLAGMWSNGTTGREGNNTISTVFPGDKGTYTLVFTYNDSGTFCWAWDGSALTQYVSDTGLKGDSIVGDKIALGAKIGNTLPAAGLRLHAAAVYKGVMTDEERINAALALDPSVKAYSRTLAADSASNWQVSADATDWGSAGVTAPTKHAAVTLTAEGAATLTMNADAELASLTMGGTGPLTFAAAEGEHTLTAHDTTVNTDVNAAAGVASLGAVSLAAGKTLTLASPDQQGGITKDTAAGTEASTVRYVGVAPKDVAVTTLEGVNTVFAGPAGTAQTHRITLTPTGGKVRFESGDYDTLTLGLSATQTEFEFAGAECDFGGGDFSFGTATVTISGGAISATKMFTSQNGNGRPNTITQTAGAITLTGTDGAAANAKVFTLGHWGTGASTYQLNGGSITAENGTLHLGHDSNATMNVAGGTLRVKGINGGGNQSSPKYALNLSDGVVSLGADGFAVVPRLTATLSGGELSAYDTNTIAHALAIAAPAEEGKAPVVLSAAKDKTMTVTGALSGAGSLTVGSEANPGEVVFSGNLSGLTGAVTVAAGALDVRAATLGETETRRFTVGSGATLTIAQGMESQVASVAAAEGDAPAGKLRIPLTEEQRTLTGYFPTGLPEGVHPWYVFEDGTEVDASSLSEGGQDYPVQLNTWSPKTPMGASGEDAGRYAWDNADNWSAKTVPSDSSANLRVKLEGDATMVLPATGALAFANMEMLGEGTLTIESEGATLAIAGNLACELSLTVATARHLSCGALQIAEGKTVALTVAENVETALGGSVTGGLSGVGTLVKRGPGTLIVAVPASDAEGALPTAPAITVEAGTLGFSGTGTVASVISGEGAVSVPAGADVTFTAANTYAGGTDIAETAAVTLPAGAKLGPGAKTVNGTVTTTNNNAALNTGAISGAGVIIVRYSYSGNTDLLANADTLGLTAAAWTGTVQLEATSTTNQGGHLMPNLYGNANSTIAFNGAMGWVNTGGATTLVTAKAKLMGEGLTLNNGGSTSLGKLVFDKVVGDGKLQGVTRANYDYAIILKDVSEFTGAISATDANNADTAIIVGEDPAPSATALSAYANYKNKVTVRTDATVASGKTWTAPGGVVVEEGATLTLPSGALLGNVPKVVNGTVTIAGNNALGTGAVTGAGTLIVRYNYTGGSNIDVLASADTLALTNAAWTGTVQLETTGDGQRGHLEPEKYGNAGSTLAFNGAKGWVNAGIVTVAAKAKLMGEGLTINNGGSGSNSNVARLVFNKVVGDGTLHGTTMANYKYAIILKDVSEFTGAISATDSHNVDTAIIVGEDPVTSTGNVLITAYANYKNKVTVRANTAATIASGKTWTAPGGVIVEDSGTLGGTGTVGSALTFNDGATLASDGATPLTAAGAVTFPSAAGAVFTVELPADFAATTNGVSVLAKSDLVAPTKDHYDLVRAGRGGAETTPVTDALLTGKADGLYVVKPSATLPADVNLPTADAAALEDAIAQAAAAAGVLAVTEVAAEEGCAIEGAALFENVVTVQVGEDSNGTAKVSYDFGIAGMTISPKGDADNALYVVLSARVTNGQEADAAAYAASTQVKVYKVIGEEETEIATAETFDNGSSEAGVKWIRFPLSELQTVTRSGETTDRGTFSLIVRAVSGDASEAGADTP